MPDTINVMCIEKDFSKGLTHGKIYEAVYINRKSGLIEIYDDTGTYVRFYLELNKIGPLVVIPSKVHRNLKLEDLLDEEG